MRNRYLYITLLSIIGFNAETYAQAIAQAPRLVISVSIGQLRTDYLENNAAAYTSDGLRRLIEEGRVYTTASYPFTPLDRASAVACMTTGTSPYYNGVTGVEWMNRNTLQREHITKGDSPQQLAVSTLGDELKMATNGRAHVFSFAPNPECAILSAGHAADGATWIQQGHWVSSVYYTPAIPWLQSFKRTYAPDANSNMSVVKAALNCMEQIGLGLDDQTDLLSLYLEAGNSTDSYLTLDNCLSFLMNGVTQRLPLERVLFVVTGSSPTEEEEREEKIDVSRYRIPTGKFYVHRTVNLLNMYLGAIYGTAQYVETSYRNQLFFNHKLVEKKNINMGELLRRSQEFILQMDGVRNCYTSHQLMKGDSEQLQRIRNGFNVEKSGDLIIEIAPGWQMVNDHSQTTTTSRLGHIHFPIIFWGAGIPSQRIQTPVTVDRIAPTIARNIRIRAPNACEAEPLF